MFAIVAFGSAAGGVVAAEDVGDPTGYVRVELESANVSLAIPVAFAESPSFEKYGTRAEAKEAAAVFHDDPPTSYYLKNPLWSSVLVDGDAVPDETLGVQVIHTGRVSASSKPSEVRRLFERGFTNATARRSKVDGRAAFAVDGYQTVLGQSMRVTEYLVFARHSDPKAVTIVMFQRKLGDAQMDAEIRDVIASVRVLEG